MKKVLQFFKDWRWLIVIVIMIQEYAFAAHHMAFVEYIMDPFYSQKIPMFRDVWHLFSGVAHLPALFLLCVYAFRWKVRFWIASAAGSWLVWQIAKSVHDKEWGFGWIHYWIGG